MQNGDNFWAILSDVVLHQVYASVYLRLYRNCTPRLNKIMFHPISLNGKVYPRAGHLEQAMKAQMGCRDTSLFFFLTSARDGSGCSTPQPGNFSLGKVIRYPLFRRIGGPHGPSGRVQVELVTTRIRSPDDPDRCESLYRLRYPGWQTQITSYHN